MALFDAGSSDLGAVIRRRTKKRDDPFVALRPLSNAAGNVGSAIGGAIAKARTLPVVGGALDALGAVGDATVSTPVGLAALGADKVLGTGLTETALRQNRGRPIWELPKTATHLASGAFGEIASDEQQDPRARLIAGLARGTEQVGSFAAPIPGAAGAARLAGRGANALPGALDASIGKPAPAAGAFASRQAPRVAAPFKAPKHDATSPAIESAKKQIAESIARQRANPTPVEELGKRYPTSRADLEDMRRRGEPIAGETPKVDVDEPHVIQLRESLKARGIDPDTFKDVVEPPKPYEPTPPSDFIKNKPDKLAVHEANEAAIVAMRHAVDTGDMGAVAEALERVVKAGGKLDHTVARLKKAGLPAPTAGELAGMARSRVAKGRTAPKAEPIQEPAAAGPGSSLEELLRESLRARGIDPDAPSNVVPIDIKQIKADNAATLDNLRRAIASARAGDAPAPTRTAGRAGTARDATPPAGAPPAPPTPPAVPAPASGLDKFLSVWNFPKAIKASLDVSAPFRQGILLLPGHPREFFGAFRPMFKALADEGYARRLDAELRATPRSERLYLAPLDDTARLAVREEQFMSSLANKVPGVSHSNRAYVTYLNKLRADTYDNVVEGWRSGGKSPTQADLDGLADVINHFTGRGDIPGVSQNVAAALNGLFFSPRFVSSRFQSIGDALGVVKSPSSLAAQQAATDMAKFVGAGLTVLTLAQLAGNKVEGDPRSASFGKIQVGPHTVDIWGGSQQVARYAAQFITGQTKTMKGKIDEQPRGKTAARFLRSKLSPTAGELENIVDLIPDEKFGPGGPSAKDRKENVGKPFGDQVIGRNFVGEAVTPSGLPGDLLAPLGPGALIEAVSKDDDKVRGAVIGLLNMLGFGTNTFDADPAPSQPGAPSGPGRVIDLGGAAGPQPTAPQTGAGRVIPLGPSGAGRVIPLPTSGGKPSSPAFALPEGGSTRGSDVAATVQQVAQREGIDPQLAIAVAMVESNLDPSAVGDNGESYGIFQERLRLGRGGFTTPDPDPARQTARFAADVRAALERGFRGTPGQLAAAVQRPYDPVGYARKVDAIYARR